MNCRDLTRNPTAAGKSSSRAVMGPVTTERRARLAIATAANLRDLGGWPTSDGRQVRSGVVYRSAELSRLHGDDLAAFAELGVRTVYDLRTAAEVAHQPDALPEGTSSEVLDVLADAEHAAPAELQKIFEDPSRANEFLRDGQAQQYFETAYRAFVTLPVGHVGVPPALRGTRHRRRPGALPLHHRQGPHRLGDRGAVPAARGARGADPRGVPAHQHRAAPDGAAVDGPVRGRRR